MQVVGTRGRFIVELLLLGVVNTWLLVNVHGVRALFVRYDVLMLENDLLLQLLRVLRAIQLLDDDEGLAVLVDRDVEEGLSREAALLRLVHLGDDFLGG